MNPIITLLTDFGPADSYVGEVKGRLLSLVPAATLVDLSHDIAPGDVVAASYVLGRAWREFPAGTVHLAVVDPGVGTARRALAVEAAGHRFVAPDNGLLSEVFAAAHADVVSLAGPEGASRTFHGRDVFAPAAARLALGVALVELGAPVRDLVHLPPRRPRAEGADVIGQVVHVDRFGTLVTNVPASACREGVEVHVGRHVVPLHETFGDVPAGSPVAFVGSGGTLEVAVRDGRAEAVLGCGRGAEVRVTGGRPG